MSWPRTPVKELTFRDAVEEYGPPYAVLMTPCAPDTDQGLLYLLYPERGLALGSSYLSTLGRPWQHPPANTRVYQ